MPAKGSAEWKGDLPNGSGTFTAAETSAYFWKRSATSSLTL